MSSYCFLTLPPIAQFDCTRRPISTLQSLTFDHKIRAMPLPDAADWTLDGNDMADPDGFVSDQEDEPDWYFDHVVIEGLATKHGSESGDMPSLESDRDNFSNEDTDDKEAMDQSKDGEGKHQQVTRSRDLPEPANTNRSLILRAPPFAFTANRNVGLTDIQDSPTPSRSRPTCSPLHGRQPEFPPMSLLGARGRLSSARSAASTSRNAGPVKAVIASQTALGSESSLAGTKRKAGSDEDDLDHAFRELSLKNNRKHASRCDSEEDE